MYSLRNWKNKLWQIGLLTLLLSSVSQIVLGDIIPMNSSPVPVQSFPLSEMTIAILFTLIIELIVALAFWGRKVKKLIVPIIIVNLISLPSLWNGLNFILGQVFGLSSDSIYYNISIILGEGIVVIFETFGIYFLSRKYVSLKESFIASILMSLSSYGIGEVINNEIVNVGGGFSCVAPWLLFYKQVKFMIIFLAVLSLLFIAQFISWKITIYSKKSFFKKAEISTKKALTIFLRAGVLFFALFLGLFVAFGEYFSEYLNRNIILFLVLSLLSFILFETYLLYRYIAQGVPFKKSLVLSSIQVAIFLGIAFLLLSPFFFLLREFEFI